VSFALARGVVVVQEHRRQRQPSVWVEVAAGEGHGLKRYSERLTLLLRSPSLSERAGQAVLRGSLVRLAGQARRVATQLLEQRSLLRVGVEEVQVEQSQRRQAAAVAVVEHSRQVPHQLQRRGSEDSPAHLVLRQLEARERLAL